MNGRAAVGRRSRGRVGTWATGALVMFGTSGPVMAQEVVALPARDTPIDGAFTEVFRIGSLNGEAWETFGEIGGTAFDGAGNLYLLDRQSSRVTVVDRTGARVREIGRPGEGPGEFRMPLNLTVFRDGRLVVADLGHRAYQIFAPDGSFERMVAMGDGSTIRVGELAADPGGEAVVVGGGGSVIAMREGSGAAGAAPTTRPVERLSMSGDRMAVSTVAQGWLPGRPEEPTTLEGGGMSLRMAVAGPRTFEPELLVGVLPDGGVAFADSSGYAVKVTGREGGVRTVLTRPFEPEPVTERMREAERRRRLDELESGEGPRMRMMVEGPGGGGTQAVSQDAIREMMQGQIAQMQFYPEVPVLMDLATTPSGTIWAQRRGPTPTDPGPIDILTPSGEYRGTLEASATVMPDALGPDGLAAYVEEDELGVPIVVVRRVPAAAR